MIGQQLLNGLVAGSVYALFALGFTLIFGVQKLLNLAHSGVFMAGAFLGYYAVVAGLPLWAASILAMIGSGLISVLVERTALGPLRMRSPFLLYALSFGGCVLYWYTAWSQGVDAVNAGIYAVIALAILFGGIKLLDRYTVLRKPQGLSPQALEFSAIISTIGANLILISIAQRVSNTKVLRFPFGTFPVQFYHVAGLRVSLLQIIIAIVVLALLAGMVWFLFKTPFGRQVRAVSGNERASQLLGVNPNAVYMQTFFLAGAMAGMAGVLIGLSFNSIHFLMGEPYLLKAFVVVVLGGLGSISGCVVAGLILGMVQTMTVAYLPSGLSDTIIYGLLFVGLLIKPSGLFGNQTVAAGVGRK